MHIYTVCFRTQEFCRSQSDFMETKCNLFPGFLWQYMQAMKIITENPGLQVKKFMIKYSIITRKEQ